MVAMVCCTKNSESSQNGSEKKAGNANFVTDTLIFKTSDRESIYVCQRLYPSGSLSNPACSEVLSVERVGDTAFVFLKNDFLYAEQNVNLPLMSDSLLRNHYPKYYTVEVDEDLPYSVYLKSSKDFIHFIRNKRKVFYLENATIRDTVMTIFGDVRVGLSSKEILSTLGLPVDVFAQFDQKEFYVILCHCSVPNKIWFAENLEDDLEADNSKTQVLLQFIDGKLSYIQIDPWIGYMGLNY